MAALTRRSSAPAPTSAWPPIRPSPGRRSSCGSSTRRRQNPPANWVPRRSRRNWSVPPPNRRPAAAHRAGRQRQNHDHLRLPPPPCSSRWPPHHHGRRPRRANRPRHHADRGQRSRGLDFAKAARHLLRQDPQVLVIGEIRMRRPPTSPSAPRSPVTWSSRRSTPAPAKASLNGCWSCARITPPSPPPWNWCSTSACSAAAAPSALAKAAPTCLQTGYRGRLPLVEWLRLKESLRAHCRPRLQAIHRTRPARRTGA